ncbi:MAG TPA: MerR family transcriptional regulator [Nocardioidaceae bacterium]
MSIGEVLNRLRSDFPDVSISKIRFLESEGLIEPERTPSGYRKFSYGDLERLRYILSEQRDHYYPLKVIKEHLDAMERGLEPPAVAGESPRAPHSVRSLGIVTEDASDFGPAPASDLRMSRAELLANSGLTDQQLTELMEFGMLRPRPGTRYFDADALVVAETIAQLTAFGLEARHIRAFKAAADREVGLIDQIVSPLSRGRDDNAAARAADTAAELGALSVRLHAALVKTGLRRPHPR